MVISVFYYFAASFVMTTESSNQGKTGIKYEPLENGFQVVQPVNCTSNSPDDWWGGMNRKEIYSGQEKKPLMVAVEQLDKAEFRNHTGLVFLIKNHKPYCAYLFIGGRPIRLVMLFDDGLRVDIGNDWSVSNWSPFIDSEKQCFKSVPFDSLNEDYGVYQTNHYYRKRKPYYFKQCFIHYLFDFATPCDYVFMIITLLLTLFFIIHKICRFTCFWLFSVICMILLLVYTALIIYGNRSFITYFLLSLIILPISYFYYTDSLFYNAIRGGVYFFLVILLLLLCLDERLSAIRGLNELLKQLIPFPC